jgi:hypothetical protein
VELDLGLLRGEGRSGPVGRAELVHEATQCTSVESFDGLADPDGLIRHSDRARNTRHSGPAFAQ